SASLHHGPVGHRMPTPVSEAAQDEAKPDGVNRKSGVQSGLSARTVRRSVDATGGALDDGYVTQHGSRDDQDRATDHDVSGGPAWFLGARVDSQCDFAVPRTKVEVFTLRDVRPAKVEEVARAQVEDDPARRGADQRACRTVQLNFVVVREQVDPESV